jgi:sugar diacid utilization regulator
MRSGVGVVVERLRARQLEIEDATHRLGEMSRAQAGLLDQLAVGVTHEHVAELQRAERSREQCVLERVRMLLAGEHSDAGLVSVGVDPELGYDLDGEHVGVIAIGAKGEAAMRGVAERLERRLLCVAREREIAWAWLGGRRVLPVAEVEQACVVDEAGDVRFVLGEPASGLEGWRMTHRQAQAALLVARRRPRHVTRYGDVALLAAAVGDEVLGRSLVGVYLAPLGAARDGGEVLLQSLRAYLCAECSVSSTAAALGVSRKTVEGRLRTVEKQLGRTLHPCPAELEVALLLDELCLALPSPDISITG